MRKSNMLWLGLAAFCGAMLFHTSQKVTDGREQLAVIHHDIRKEEETLRVLQAEWSYLNQPDRLEKLVSAHLALEPMKGRQFTKMEDLENAPVPEPVAENESETPAVSEEAPTLAVDDAPMKIEEAAVVAAAETTNAPLAAMKILTEEKPAPEKKPAPVAKPAAQKPTAVKPVTKPAQVKPAQITPAAASAPATDNRNLGDVMKSLGVH